MRKESSVSKELHFVNFEALSLYTEVCEAVLMCVPAAWPATDIGGPLCCLCVGVSGLAPITHRKQALALSSTLNTQEIHTGNRVSTPCARLAHSSILDSQRRASRQSPAAHSADSLSNFSAACTVFTVQPPSPQFPPHPRLQTLPRALKQSLFFRGQKSGQRSPLILYNLHEFSIHVLIW